jgi:uncharacterized membrane protein YdjX (TVP38/TMEM64 family)
MHSTDQPESTGPGRPRRAAALTRRAGLAVVCVALGVLLFAYGPSASSAWATVRANLSSWQDWSERNPVPALAAFFATYALAAALPLPILTVMSLLAGALFGRATGTAVAALGYTVGVTIAFLAARRLLRGWVRARAGNRLRRIERGFERDGAFYLLTLRLMPSVPFFLVNVLMALTPMRTRHYALVSCVGVLPMTFLYTGVGSELASLQSPSDVLSAPLVASLAALALLPLLARKVLRRTEAETPA